MLLKTIRKEIERSPKSRYQICKDTGIDEAFLSRIMKGRACGLKTLETLCEYLDLELVKKKSKKKR